MSKRALMTVAMWLTMGLFVPLFIGCGGGGGTTTDLATVPTSSTSGGGSSTDTAAQIAAAVGKAPTFEFAKPTFSPTSGGAGLVVTLTATSGTGTTTSLASVTGVTFAGSGSAFVLAHPSDTTITVKVPQGARNGLLSLTGGTNTVASTSLLSFFTEPTVTGFTPNVVRAGLPTTLTVFGTNLCAAQSVSLNAGTVATFDQTSECSGSTNTQAGNTKLTVTVTPSTPISAVTVVTANGTGVNSSSAYAVSGLASSNTRVAILQSFNSTLTSTANTPAGASGFYVVNPTTMIQAGNVIVLGSTNGLASISLAGAFLGPIHANFGLSAPFAMTTVTSGSLTSVFLTSIPTRPATSTADGGLTSSSTVYQWDAGNGAALSSRTSLPDLRVGAETLVGNGHPTVGPLAATPAGNGHGGTLYVGDSGYLGSLFSASTSGPTTITPSLVSFSAAGGFAGSSGSIGQTVGMGYGLNSVWALTSIGSVYVIGNASGGTSGAATLFAPFTASRPSTFAFGLNSIWIAGGDSIGTLSSAGAAWPAAQLASFNLRTGNFATSGLLASGLSLTSWGSGVPLVSVLAFDGAPGTAGANLWYLDVGQNALVRCAASKCATGLTSFALANVPGASAPAGHLVRSRTLLVDSLGSIWFAASDAVERLIP